MEGIPGSAQESPRSSLRAWIELVIAAVLGVFLALLAVGFIDLAASSHRASAGSGRGATRSWPWSASCSSRCVGGGRSAEHRLRRHDPVAASFAADPFGRSPSETSGLATSHPVSRPTPYPRPSRTPRRPIAVRGHLATHIPPNRAYAPDTPLPPPGPRDSSTFTSVGPTGWLARCWSSPRPRRRRGDDPWRWWTTVAFAFRLGDRRDHLGNQARQLCPGPRDQVGRHRRVGLQHEHCSREQQQLYATFPITCAPSSGRRRADHRQPAV